MTRWLGRLLALGLVLQAGWTAPALAARNKTVAWTARLEPADARAGEAAQVVLEAKIDAPWHLYSLTPPPGGKGPIPTSITLAPGNALTGAGKPVQPPPEKELDEGFGIQVEHYSGAVAFGLPVKVGSGGAGVRQAALKVRFQTCKSGICMPPSDVEIPVAFTVAAGEARSDHTTPITKVPQQPAGYKKAGAEPPAAVGAAVPVSSGGAHPGGSLLAFLGIAFGAGLLAVLTPCVFPMIPITVSFFTRQQEGARGSGLSAAVAYCLGIIGSFTSLGLIVTLAFGAGGVNRLAANPIVNSVLAGVFVLLAFNLFGAFELVLPPALVEKAQAGTSRGRFVGPLLMGLTFALTSFACTGPFVGSLLAATTQGELVWPVAGMLAFSTGLALPFFFLALFPQLLNRLPRSGSWLVTVKAYMGFLLLAAAMVFLHKADQVASWHLLSRPTFLSLWSTIALVAGLYMLGWLQLPHSGGDAVGPLRRVIGLATATAGVFFVMAADGRPLGELDAFVPRPAANTAANPITWTEDYEVALARGKAEGKPIFLNFTGAACTNCHLMEANILPRPEVAGEVEKFIAVELYTDKTDASSARNKELQEKLFGTVAIPYYAVLGPDGRKLEVFEGMTRNPKEFAEFLRSGYSKATRVARGG